MSLLRTTNSSVVLGRLHIKRLQCSVFDFEWLEWSPRHGPARASAIVRLVSPDHVCGTLCRSAFVSLTSPLVSSDGR